MSRTLNKVILVGNVGANPDIKVSDNGSKAALFSLATNWKSARGAKENTDWHKIKCWGKLADFVSEHIYRGDKLYVEGYLSYYKYEHEGIVATGTEVKAKEILLLTEFVEVSK